MVPALLAFIGAAFLIAITPGPSAAVILRQTVRGGRRAALATVLGNEAGVLFWGVAAALGLSALVTASQIAYEVLRFGGAAVLLWLGVQSLLAARRGAVDDGPGGDADAPRPASTWWPSFRLGLVTNAANPKAAVFAVSFLPQFVPEGAPVLPSLLALAVLWTLVDLVWFVSAVWVVALVREAFARPAVRRWMEAVSGTVLIGLGVRVVTAAP
ncbi:LysE family translocator [Nocardiopsis potens]|uniref:LysE family translocator n=1 Tax=Nocardiopsis potens TaxID=1246458 RepID=UPI00034A2D12|nr:LysE family translocator [Nocardiopsis potens]